MSIIGVNIERGNVGASPSLEGDNISLLIAVGIPVDYLAGSLGGATKLLLSVDDAVALGITQEVDSATELVLHRHISEFFRFAGNGTKLYLHCVGKLEDVTVDELMKPLLDAKGDVKIAAIALSKVEGTATRIDGIDGDVRDAVAFAGNLALTAREKNMPLSMVVEGRNIADDLTTVGKLQDVFEGEGMDKVSVYCGQDLDYTDTLTGSLKKMADVGTVLGVMAKAQVSENIGWVEMFNLSSTAKKSYLRPGLSNAISIENQFDKLKLLDQGRWIFPITYTGISGYRLNNDFTCIETKEDVNGNLSEGKISYSRVLDKSIRLLYEVLIPNVKGKIATDPMTGNLTPGAVMSLKVQAEYPLKAMVQRGDIQAFDVQVAEVAERDDVGDRNIKVTFGIQPYDHIGLITGTINLKARL